MDEQEYKSYAERKQREQKARAGSILLMAAMARAHRNDKKQGADTNRAGEAWQRCYMATWPCKHVGGCANDKLCLEYGAREAAKALGPAGVAKALEAKQP